jgi:hypothetical protein
MLPELIGDEWAEALDATVIDLLNRARVTGPPVDARDIAATLRLVVAWDERLSGRARFVRMGRRASKEAQGSILLRPEPRAERLQWAIAHELGEEVTGPIFARLGIEPGEAPPAVREGLANQLAGRLLLPTAWFVADAEACNWDLAALKARYATASHELIARRMLEFPAPVIMTVFDHGQLTWRRSNGPRRCPTLSAAERDCWQAAHVSGRPARRESQGCLIRAWPIHEPGWPREILRTQSANDVECWLD